MEWLNYHHLLYFWVVAKQGSIVRASEELRLAHPTISGQIHRLEDVLGEKLFTRRGRNLALTESGRVAFRYADEIFPLGREFVDTLKGRASGKPLRLVVGTADVLPPSLVRRFLEPAFRLGQPVQVICRADKSVQEFLAELALHSVDVVIADGPAGSGASRCARSAIRWANAGPRSSPPRSSPPSSVAGFPARSMRRRFSFPARPRRSGGRSSTGSTPKASGRASSRRWTTARSRRSSVKTASACSRRRR